jgi:hypothetical protein
MSWRERLRDAVVGDDAAASAQETREDLRTLEREQRRAARDLFAREIVPGVYDVIDELHKLGRQVQIFPQMENTNPQIDIHIPRPGRADLRLRIVAPVNAEGFTVELREEERGNHYFAFPSGDERLTREVVAAAISKAYEESLSGNS